MLKTLLLCFTTLALVAPTTAQNLVPNPSFEDTVDCEIQTQCMLLKAAGWYNPNIATPDLFDSDLNRSCGNPLDVLNISDLEPRTGLRMPGTIHWYGAGSSGTREYLMVQLQQPLLPTVMYEVALSYLRYYYADLAVDRIGIYFGIDSLHVDHGDHLEVIPQVELMDPNSTFLIESENWIQLTDTFVASGGEQWMIIGTFNGPDEVNGITVVPGSNPQAYYFFDDVSVTSLGHTIGITELGAGAGFHNNEFQIHWRGVSDLDKLMLFDASGRLIIQRIGRWNTGSHQIQSRSELASGMYTVHGFSGARHFVARFVK